MIWKRSRTDVALNVLLTPGASPAVIRAGEVFRELYGKVTGKAVGETAADDGGDLILIGEAAELAAAFPALAPAAGIDPGSDAYRILDCRGGLSPAVEPLALGVCRVREGCTVLVDKEKAPEAGLPVRQPTLDEIMVHLEKEAAQ